MMAYALPDLKKKDFKKLETEEFEDSLELCSKILICGINSQIRRGLGRSYVSVSEELSLLRGKIDVSESVKHQTMLRKKMLCTYDVFAIDFYLNQIIRSTLELLLRSRTKISRDIKRDARKVIIYFDGVQTIDLKNVNWNQKYTRGNQNYRVLITMCYLISKGLLQTQMDGKEYLMDFTASKKMHSIFQNFVFKYYQIEYSHVLDVKARQIEWKFTGKDKPSERAKELLPKMQSDITLIDNENPNKILIIDTKYYENVLQTNRFGRSKHRSQNLYQIFTYIKNKEFDLLQKNDNHKRRADISVSGMLLYAKTEDEKEVDVKYEICNNCIEIKTLDLNRDFSEIKLQLNQIVKDFFGEDLKSASELKEAEGF